MNRRKFLVNGLLTGAGTAGVLGAASARPSPGYNPGPIQATLQTSQIVNTDGARLDTALSGLFQTASHADGVSPSGQPATVTITTGYTSTIPNSVRVDWQDPAVRVFAGRLLRTSFPGGGSSNGAYSYVSGAYEGGGVVVEIMYDGANIDFATYGQGGAIQVLVDGVPAGPFLSVPGDGNFYSVNVSFNGVRAIRRLTFRSGTECIGFNTGPTDTIWRSPRQLGPRMIVMGDSYTEGAGANLAEGFPAVMGRVLGLEDIWTSGSGGTGYLANGSPGAPGRYTFRQRVGTDIIAYNPQIVLICGGINDTVNNASDAAALQTEATLLYRQILNNLQNCRLYVCGPWRPPAASNGNTSAVNAALQAAVASVPGVKFIDVSHYFTGTGYAGAPAGDGNSDYYIGYDRVHPSAAGHLYIGTRLAGDFAALQPF